MKLSSLSKYAIWRSRTYGEQLMLAKVRVNRDQFVYEFFTDQMEYYGVPSGACGNPGMPRRMHYRKGSFYLHEEYGPAVIVSISPYELSQLNPMNETELLAKLARGTNLNKLFQIVHNQKTISTNKLYLLLDEVLTLQKEWVHRYQSSKNAGKILAHAAPNLERSTIKTSITGLNISVGDEWDSSHFPVKGKVISVDYDPNSQSRSAIIEFVYPKKN